MSECKCRIVFGHTVSAASARIERCERCNQDAMDRERLDYLEQARRLVEINGQTTGWHVGLVYDPKWTLREAIDAVRASLPQEQKDDG